MYVLCVFLCFNETNEIEVSKYDIGRSPLKISNGSGTWDPRFEIVRIEIVRTDPLTASGINLQKAETGTVVKVLNKMTKWVHLI